MEKEALADSLPFVQPAARYSHGQMLRDMERLCGAYPENAQWEVAGRSEHGREIPVLRLGKPGAKFQVLIQGAIHGREHMTAGLLMALSDFWLARGLPGDVCWHILPMTNPDGVEVSQSGVLDEAQAAIYQGDRAAGRAEEPCGRYAARWKANGLGIDLNRNFPSGWEPILDPAIPSSQRYKGEKPFSAAEARLLRDYTLAHSFDVTLSYHATGSVIYWQFGSRQPVNDRSASLGRAVSAVTGYPMEGCDSLEGAGYKDWVMDALGIPSLTIEIGTGEAPLKEEEIPDIFARNREVLPAVARWLEDKEKEEKKNVH